MLEMCIRDRENWWPRDEMWNKHYFGQNAFNAAPDRYDASITKGFGKPEGIEDCLLYTSIYALGMTTEEPERAKQLMGEACFIRGLLMFELSMYWGEIPVIDMNLSLIHI